MTLPTSGFPSEHARTLSPATDKRMAMLQACCPSSRPTRPSVVHRNFTGLLKRWALQRSALQRATYYSSCLNRVSWWAHVPLHRTLYLAGCWAFTFTSVAEVGRCEIRVCGCVGSFPPNIRHGTLAMTPVSGGARCSLTGYTHSNINLRNSKSVSRYYRFFCNVFEKKRDEHPNVGGVSWE